MGSPLSFARRDLQWILPGAAMLRILLFSGFVLGDDPAYGRLVHQVLTHGYPAVAGMDVFASRPLLIGLLTASVKTFGWSEWAFVFPVLLSSLAGIAATYAIGAFLHGRRAGVIGATVLTLLPLDLIYATTVTNDIVASGVAGCGAVIALWGTHAAVENRPRVLASSLAGGFLVGMSAAVKLSSVALGLPLFMFVGFAVWRRSPYRRASLAVAAGWLAAQSAIALFFRTTSGHWLANYQVEFAFNRAYMVEPYLGSWKSALLSYPQWAFLLQRVGPINHIFFPYGLLFPIALVSLTFGVWKRTRGVALLGVWMIAVFAVLEFASVRLLPQYVPIHRLPRFLHAVALPAAALIGVVLADWSRDSVWTELSVWAALILYSATSLDGSLAAWARHRDAMLDARAAANIALVFQGTINSDDELLDYLRFRDGYQHQERFVTLLPGSVQATVPMLVMVGGGRRVDLDPQWIVPYVPRKVPGSWMKVADMPGVTSPWRLIKGAIYAIYATGVQESAYTTAVQESASRDSSTERALLASACPAGPDWKMQDVVDVGQAGSEAAHHYTVDTGTWRGQRTMLDERHNNASDDGRAFRGGQRFLVSDLSPGRDVCVVIRIDAGVRHQASRWLVDDRPAAATDTGALAADGWWRTKMFVAPGNLIAGPTAEFREVVSSSDLDVNAFRIEVFQVSIGESR